MFKIKRIAAAGLAATMAMSAFGFNVLAAENTTAQMGDPAESETVEYLGRMLVVYENGEMADMIPIENEADDLSVVIDGNEAKIYTDDGVLDTAVDVSNFVENTTNVTATIYHTYKITANNVCLRASMSTSSDIIDYLQKGMIFGSRTLGTSSVWIYGEVLDDLSYYSYSIDGYVGYVSAIYASYIS